MCYSFSCDNFVFYVFDFNVIITQFVFVFNPCSCFGVVCIRRFLLINHRLQNSELLRNFR